MPTPPQATENLFALLGLETVLVIPEESLQAAFREAGRTCHPDAGGSEQHFARLRHAFDTLSSPGRRLLHWLELRGIATDSRGTVDPGLMDLFGRVGEINREAESLARRRAAARTALARALTENETHRLIARLESTIAEVDAALSRETNRFPAIQQAAPDHPSPADPAQTARNLAFLEKWRASLRSLTPKLL